MGIKSGHEAPNKKEEICVLEEGPVVSALMIWLHSFSNAANAHGGLSVSSVDSATGPPWGSKGRINRAGSALRAHKTLSKDEFNALDIWRASHRYVLNTFQALLRGKTAGTTIVVAQRLKRRITIVDKLFREPRMELARMDDVAGCR